MSVCSYFSCSFFLFVCEIERFRNHFFFFFFFCVFVVCATRMDSQWLLYIFIRKSQKMCNLFLSFFPRVYYSSSPNCGDSFLKKNFSLCACYYILLFKWLFNLWLKSCVLSEKGLPEKKKKKIVVKLYEFTVLLPRLLSTQKTKCGQYSSKTERNKQIILIF